MNSKVGIRRGVPVGIACILAAMTLAACSSSSATGSTSSTATPASTAGTPPSDGTWPGVGTICSRGGGGGAPSATTRGVTSNSINIATFADPGNSVQPGLNEEFFQAAQAFSDWCNASGGINGRKIVVDNHDAALFNAAQVTNQACNQDFMSVGGGMALDQPSVSVRVGCGLGQISGFTVSNQAVSAPLQVNPGAINNTLIEAGWYGALAKRYPAAVKHYGTGSANNASIIEPTNKWRDAAVAQGYKLVDYQLVPLSVADWAPYVTQAQSKGVEALQPPTDSTVTPYIQAMNTAGYNPPFMLLTTQYYNSSTAQAAASTRFPSTYLAIQYWPLELASQSPGLEQLISIMHKYRNGDQIDWDHELAFASWVLFAKSASACGSELTTSCVLSHAAGEQNWSAGGLTAPVAHLAMADQNPTPSDCFLLMTVQPQKFVYDRADTSPNNQIWNCDPKSLFHVSASG
jgi:ABC-type branched-subunit amino acid transport system substrate-binding protein